MIGVATWNTTEGTLAERIRRYGEMGFDAVSLLPSHALAMCRGEAPDVEEALTAHALALTIHGGMAGMDKPIDESALLADMEAFLKWQARTGALRSINYDAAKRHENSEVVYDSDGMHSVLNKMLQMTKDAGVTVGVEDWPRDPKQLAPVADLLQYPHYGILIDLGHMNMRICNDKPGFAYPIDAARKYLDDITIPINELHLHNNDGVGDLHAPLDTGTADFLALAALLKPKCDRDRTISTVELVPRFCGITDEDAVQATAQALKFWRERF